VIESIQSRVHIIQIPQPSTSQIETIMNKIITAENINISEGAKEYLLMMTGSSVRILINYLEKMYILGQPIDLDLCKKLCSNISFQQFENYIQKIKEKNISGAIDVLFDIHDYGYSVIDILDYFFTFVKITTTLDEDTKYRIIPLLCKYITVFHNLHEDGIELALFTNNIYKLFHP
jgi:DNA polymerase III gamma/tau subunit